MNEVYVFNVFVQVELDCEATWADIAYALNRAAAQVLADAEERKANPFGPIAPRAGREELEVIVADHEVAHKDLHVRRCSLEIDRARLRPPLEVLAHGPNV